VRPGESTGRLIGSATTVAAQHSLMAKDRHFEDVVGGGGGELMPGGAGQGRPEECDAKCDAAGSRIERRGAAENDRTGCRHSGCSGFFGPGIARQDARGA